MAVAGRCSCIKENVPLCLCFFIVLLSALTNAQIRYSIQEELESGTVVGDLVRDLGLDLRKLSARRIRISSDSARRYFNINHKTGKLVISDRIDRETLCEFSGTCTLSLDVVLENPYEQHNVDVEILDANDNSPLFPRDEYQLEISEGAQPGARFSIEGAQDSDDASNSVRHYRLTSNEHLALDSTKPPADGKHIELVLKKPFDRELLQSHQFLLTATDGGSPPRSGTAKINVRVLDTNDNVPVFGSSVYKVKLRENSPVGALVIKLNATDRDEGSNGEVYYSFSSYTPDRVRQVFSVDTDSGEIRVKSNVDYEETNSYEMYIQAADRGQGAVAVHCKVVVEVLDVNDNPPEIVLSSLSSPVREDARADTVVALISINDKDSGQNKQVSLDIIPPNLPFKIKSFRNHYTIVTSAFLDRETISSYNVTVTASDGGTPPLSSSMTVRVEVADVNDNPPRFEQTSYTVYVSENNAPSAPLCVVKATDPDAGENARITYTVLNDNNHGISVASYVSVKPASGEVYALRSFDFEKLREFHFQVKAQDNGVPPLSRVATVYIYIMDSNDHSPQFVRPGANGSHSTETILRNSEAGVLVSRVLAWDLDAGENAWLLYNLHHPPELDLFKVHEYTGEIRTTRRVNEDNSTVFSLTVHVRDHGLPPRSASTTINIAVMELPPKVAPDPKRIIRPHGTMIFSHVTLYLIIALSATTFVFLLTIFVLAIVRCHAYCSQPDACSCSPCCGSKKKKKSTMKKAPKDGGGGGGAAGGGGGGAAGGGGGATGGVTVQQQSAVMRRDLKVEPHYIEVRGNGSLTKTYCYKTCLTATSGSDTFMFYNTGRPLSGTWGSGADRFFTGQSGQFVRRLSMPDATAIQEEMRGVGGGRKMASSGFSYLGISLAALFFSSLSFCHACSLALPLSSLFCSALFQDSWPKAPNADWRYSASLRAGMQSSVHMEESSVMQGAQGVLVQNWPTVSSAPVSSALASFAEPSCCSHAGYKEYDLHEASLRNLAE
ncbi:Protocadherin alpha-C2 [Labeo rohita]|uniref:Protocadherin alpha-C2 n=1 Tax=Labeo rohita TaxID=84645 RepID=A0ABQ8L5V4_LABRO|nr:Protocadherin alpha-C2 [Labeo rohita]